MKKIKVKFERFLILCIQTIVRFIYYHPFVICLVFFLLKLYKSFPSLLAFLVSSSPVIVCTFLLLGLLLSYGEPTIPVIMGENKRNWDASSIDIGSSSRHLYAKENENISIENHVDCGNYNDEKAVADEEVYHAVDESEGNKNINTVMIKISSGEEVKKVSYVVENEVNQLIQGKEHHVQGSYEDDIVLAKKLGGGAETGANVIPFSIINEETENFMLEIGGPALDHHFDSLGLACQSVEDHHVSSDTESYDAESSSPDASMANIIPLLEELHPLLNSEHVSITKLDAASEGSLVDHESNDNSIDEKDLQEKDEAQEEKVGYDVTAAVRWTEDDQKNVMDLGSSELERNQRLEILIAKRRARKNLTFRMDRNLIDWDANDRSFLGRDELSHLHVQVPSRRNPFDIPNDSEETMDLPPIPGSAPSSLLPRQNPFDFLYDNEEQDGNLTGETWDLQNFVPASRPECLFRRVDTFDLGRRDLQQERHQSRFKPYFTSEMDLEGTSIFQRQYSDNGESKASFVSGSDTVSPATDQEHKRELERQEVNTEVELSSLAEHGTDAGDRQIHTSKEESDDADKGKREHPTNYIEIDEANPSASWSSLNKQSTIDEALQYAGQSGNLDSSPFECLPTSVFIDENRSRLSEVDDNSEFNAAKIGKPVIQEVPDQDGSLISLELIESSECMDSLIVMEKISEISIQSISDLSKSSGAIESPVLIIREADVLKTVNSSDEESNEVQSSALDIDKTLLAEIDGSANSHIRELPSNHEGSDLMFQKNSQSEDIASGSKSSEVNQDQIVDTQTWYPRDPRDNIEQTVYIPKIQILASSLVEELSESNQPPEEGMASHVSELNFDWPSTATLVLQSSEACTTQNNVSQTVTDSEIPVIETKSIEEINAYQESHSYFEQISNESNKNPIHEANTDSDFPDVEARSIEEIHSYFKKITEESPSLPIYNEGEARDSPDNVDMDAKLIRADLHIVDANSIEAIDGKFGQLSHSISNKAPKSTEESPSATVYYLDESRDSHDNMHMDAIIKLIQSDRLVVEGNSIEDSQFSHC
ncbi:LOW QUALITY PROTEIN: uncharacterized protein LOC141815491 [Curcuma longa]|uniref:LOW QUALITY PROTEIN: uncharacterized protein LOC141815491 n=1 Tax=Curcuma longa TaxID=136217 RepID=UPI003D9F0776